MSISKGPFTKGVTRSGEWVVTATYRDYLKDVNRIKVTGFATEEDAVGWEAAFHLRSPREHLTMTLNEFFEQEYIGFLRSTLKPSLRGEDITTGPDWFIYDRALYEAKLKPVFGNTRICDFTPELIRDFYVEFKTFTGRAATLNAAGPLNASGYCPHYTNQVFAILYNILEHTTRLEIERRSNPSVFQSSSLTPNWLQDCMASLFSLLEGDIILYAAFAFMYYCNMHETEIAALTKSDFDFELSTVEVARAGRIISASGRRELRYGRVKERTIEVPPAVMAVAGEIFRDAAKDDMPFWYVTRYSLVKALRTVAGIKFLPTLSLPKFHRLCRESFKPTIIEPTPM